MTLEKYSMKDSHVSVTQKRHTEASQLLLRPSHTNQKSTNRTEESRNRNIWSLEISKLCDSITKGNKKGHSIDQHFNVCLHTVYDDMKLYIHIEYAYRV